AHLLERLFETLRLEVEVRFLLRTRARREPGFGVELPELLTDDVQAQADALVADPHRPPLHACEPRDLRHALAAERAHAARGEVDHHATRERDEPGPGQPEPADRDPEQQHEPPTSQHPTRVALPRRLSGLDRGALLERRELVLELPLERRVLARLRQRFA